MELYDFSLDGKTVDAWECRDALPLIGSKEREEPSARPHHLRPELEQEERVPVSALRWPRPFRRRGHPPLWEPVEHQDVL